jgi:hypothetical protein
MILSHLDHIDADEPWESGYWSGRLGVSRAQLSQAIRAVGDKVVDIREYLASEQHEEG